MTIPVQNPRIVQAIRDGLGIVGRSRFELDEVLAPAIIVGDLGKPSPEPRFAHGESLLRTNAGNEIVQQLDNPAGSGVNVRVTRIYFSAVGGGYPARVRLTLSPGTPTTTVGPGFPLDRRGQQPNTTGQAILRTQDNFATAPPNLAFWWMGAEESLVWEGDVLLAPGDTITLSSAAANLNDSLAAGWFYTEFPAGETRLI